MARWPPIRWAAIALLVLVNVVGLLDLIPWMLGPNQTVDFTLTFVPVVSADNPYHVGGYVWSPLAVPILALVVPLGLGFWYLLHALALLLIRPWWMAALVALSWPFWWDTASGNVGVFAFVAAWWAVQGNRVGTIAFLALVLLMPRPLMLPLVAWLLWQQPWARVPFVAATLAHLGIVAGIGLLDEWAIRLTSVAGAEAAGRFNLALTRWLPLWAWAVLFLPLAAWLTCRGRLGLASLAASPYLFPSYLLMGFLVLRRNQPQAERQARGEPAHRARLGDDPEHDVTGQARQRPDRGGGRRWPRWRPMTCR